MARKVSKHSRAARRGELAMDAEIKSLENIPTAQETDVANSIIRATAKNESLLSQKMNKKRGSKNKISKESLSKSSRSFRVDSGGRLSTKIQHSIERFKNVQFLRKSSWDTIDKVTKEELEKLRDDGFEVVSRNRKTKAQRQEDNDKEILDSMEVETFGQVEEKEREKEKEALEKEKSSNPYSLLVSDEEA
ncbi:hypothetical protein LJB42_002279 [Komagataella kurtzmanii]|nr:hypothetical protein LJB42_002279 [Komagataella kurtzmanii]